TTPDSHPLDLSRRARGVAFGWVPAAFRSVAAELLAAQWAPHWAQEIARELAREPADVVVVDFVLVGALVAAEAARVPSVALVHTLYPRPARGGPPYGPGWRFGVDAASRLRDAVGRSISNRLHAREALPLLNLARQRCGLRPVRRYFAQYDRADRVVVLVHPEFDSLAHFPANVRLVGTPIEETASPSGCQTRSMPDERPLVLVSLSTLEQGQATLMKRILLSLADLPVRALVTLGPALAESRFTAPANVTLTAFLSHRSVLPDAAAVVTQCGLGTVMKALAHGVPMVCMPLVGDQPDNAARIEALGAGVRLAPSTGPDRIRAAIVRVVTDPAFRLGAQRVARAIADQDPVQNAVDEINSVLVRAVAVSR